ncbi:DUF6507 family protein [Actinoplanes sp. NPDC051475]|uniref:DUF6507 family protein n=1 Tax=Actinoplanes sp. NPDC051475 TaxID=3157225 RepID=UPI00344FBFC6
MGLWIAPLSNSGSLVGSRVCAECWVDGVGEGAAKACGSEIVAGALVGFAEHKAPAMKAVVERTSRALTGAVKATKAYIDGDLEMARTAQANAVAAPSGNDSRGR